MKVALLGTNCTLSAAPIDHTVDPFVGLPAPSVQANTVPPHSWTSIPRCCWYQARSATGSFALKKIPPIPVTLFIAPPNLDLVHAGAVRSTSRTSSPYLRSFDSPTPDTRSSSGRLVGLADAMAAR